MSGTEPGETGTPRREPGARRLAQPPSARYAGRAGGAARVQDVPSSGERSAVPGPFARAAIVGIAGAFAMVGIAAFIGSGLGLLFVVAATGTTIGLLVARAAVPGDDALPISRRNAMWLAIATVLAAVAVADVAIWLVALSEGGVLGLFDYLWTTFGATIPGVAVVGAITAAWGTTVGPVQG